MYLTDMKEVSIFSHDFGQESVYFPKCHIMPLICLKLKVKAVYF